MIKKFFGKTLFRYIAAGGFSYVIELSTLLALHIILKLTVEVSTAIAFWVGLITSFLLQKLFAFKDYRKNVRAISRQLLPYVILVVFNYVFTLLLVGVFPGKYIIISRTLALIITTVWNYFFYRYIFNEKSPAKEKLAKKHTPFMKLGRKKVLIITLLILPIILFNLRFLLTGNKIIPGDPDYYFQLYGAFRRSVLEFHQFPLLDAWIGGGVPLFANIQFGLVSLQAPIILLFGAVLGWKIAIVGYQLIAFFGYLKLFKDQFKTPALRAILLAYVPIFGGFFTYRTIAGHFTFLLMAFFPWLLLFFLNRSRKHSWIWFSLILSFMIWTSPHYTTIMSIVVLGLWFLFECVQQFFISLRTHSFYQLWNSWFRDSFIFLLKSALLTTLLTLYRLYFVFTYIRDFPRPELTSEPYTGVLRGLYAIWGPNQYSHPPNLPSGWGWVEASAYIGIGTLIALAFIGISLTITVWKSRKVRIIQKELFTYSLPILVLLFISFFIIAMGNFGNFSPYAFLYKLPVFNNMRVATRWLEWSSVIALLIIAAYNHKRFQRLITVSVGIAALELFITGSNVIGKAYFVNVIQYRAPTASFNQEFDYRVPRPNYNNDINFLKVYSYDRNLYETTLNNLGQVIADDSLLDTRQPNSTIRCGENQGNCNFISANAKIVYWSPNKLILERLGPGVININMNTGRGWLENGKYIFKNDKIIDAKSAFLISDPSKTITLTYAPRFSLPWLFR